MSDYLFVYGTLQPGLTPAKVADLAAKLQPVGKGYVRGLLYDLGGYPGAMPDPRAKSIIVGTVMELPEDASVLRRLDGYEGFDLRAPETSEYIRVRQLWSSATAVRWSAGFIATTGSRVACLSSKAVSGWKAFTLGPLDEQLRACSRQNTWAQIYFLPSVAQSGSRFIGFLRV